MEQEKEITIDRVEAFRLPIFLHLDAITDEQCDYLIKFCRELEYKPSVPNNDFSLSSSVNQNVMSLLPELKQYFELVMQNVSSFIMKQVSEGFEIRNSWATKTTKNQSSTMHTHKNYYMAGVLYLQDDSQLFLENPFTWFSNYVFEVTENTPYTCMNSIVRPPKNSFLIMPSYIKHQVLPWEKDDVTRYSIAMNFHPVGTYGLETSKMTV